VCGALKTAAIPDRVVGMAGKLRNNGAGIKIEQFCIGTGQQIAMLDQ
jgi:hypothetical protein